MYPSSFPRHFNIEDRYRAVKSKYGLDVLPDQCSDEELKVAIVEYCHKHKVAVPKEYRNPDDFEKDVAAALEVHRNGRNLDVHLGIDSTQEQLEAAAQERFNVSYTQLTSEELAQAVRDFCTKRRMVIPKKYQDPAFARKAVDELRETQKEQTKKRAEQIRQRIPQDRSTVVERIRKRFGQ